MIPGNADNVCMPVVLQPPPKARPRSGWPPQTAIVEMEIIPAVRPAWIGDTSLLRVPVPIATPQQLDDEAEVLVWGKADSGGPLPLVARGDLGIMTAYPWDEWSRHILLEHYASWRRRPLHTRLPISYHRVPARWRHHIAMHMFRSRRDQPFAFPSPLFEGGFEALRDVVGSKDDGLSKSVAPCVCLTHDIDGREGFAHVKSIAQVEKSLGVRSSWNVVTHEYSIDEGILEWLVQDGFEIGLHDFAHDNKLVYLSESDMRRRIERCRPFMSRWGVKGFRSPSWFRTPQLYRVLRDFVTYDASALDFDWLCPAGRGGVLVTTPFEIDGLIEIPTTIPFEAPLLEGCDGALLPSYWEPKVDWLLSVRGHAVVNTHPEPHYTGNPSMIRVYARFLERLLDRYEGRSKLPREIAEETGRHA